MRALLPTLIALSPVFAADSVPAPVAPPATLQPAAAAGNPQKTGPRAEFMKEMREVQVRYQEIRAKADQDPELLKLRTAAEEAQKAYRAKLQEILAKDPAYAEVMAKREEVQAKMMAPMGTKPTGPAHLTAPSAGSPAQASTAPVAPLAVPAPVPAVAAPAPTPIPAPAKP